MLKRQRIAELESEVNYLRAMTMHETEHEIRELASSLIATLLQRIAQVKREEG